MKLSTRTKIIYILLGLILVGFLIKILPPLSYDFLVNFDSIYHSRIGQIVADTGWVPSWDFVAGGRPHLYPPMYHLLLGYTSKLISVPVIDFIDYALPLVSALLVLPVFFLMKKERGLEMAMTGAFLVAFNPIITAQSYDSPQLFGLFLFPLIVYFLLRRNYLAGGALLGITLFFNYFITITIIAVLLVFSLIRFLRGDKRAVVYAGLMVVIGLGLASPWLFITASRAGECFDPSTAVSAITNEGISFLLPMIPFVAIIGFGLLYYLRKREDEYSLIWMSALGVGTVGFLASIVLPQLHPYDQLLLFGFSLVFLIPEVVKKREKLATIILIMLVLSVFAVIQVKPALSKADIATVNWVKNNVSDGDILANPEVSGIINTITKSRSIRTEFDLFLECIPDAKRWDDMFTALSTSDKELAEGILEEYGVDYVIVDSRDVWNYHFDIDKFKDMDLKIAFRYEDSIVYERE